MNAIASPYRFHRGEGRRGGGGISQSQSVSRTNTHPYLTRFGSRLFLRLLPPPAHREPPVPRSALFRLKKGTRVPEHVERIGRDVARARPKRTAPGKLFRELLQFAPARSRLGFFSLFFFFIQKLEKKGGAGERTRESAVSRAYFSLCVCTMLLS